MRHPLILLFALFAFAAASPAAIREVECSQALADASICPTVGETAVLISYWLPQDDDFVCSQQGVTEDACLPREIGRRIPSSADRLMAPFLNGYQAQIECTAALVALGICTDLQLGEDVRNPVEPFGYANTRLFQFGIDNPSRQSEAMVSEQENQEMQERKRRPVETSPIR